MFVLLFFMWLLLAGEISVSTCLWGAAVCALLHWFCYKVFGYSWHLRRRSLKKLWMGVEYLGYLLVEMLKAGFAVMKLIYTRGRDMEPQLIWFDSDLKSDSALAMLANSITLTAGTITAEVERGRFCIHALDASLARGIEDCEFQRRLESLEE